MFERESERDWGETLKMLTRPEGAPRARKTLTPEFTKISTDFDISQS